MLTAHHRSAALVEALDGRMPTLEIQAFAVRKRNGHSMFELTVEQRKSRTMIQ